MARLRRKFSAQAFQKGLGYSGNVYRGRVQRMSGGRLPFGALLGLIPKLGAKLIPKIGAKLIPKIGSKVLNTVKSQAVTHGKRIVKDMVKRHGKKLLAQGGKAAMKALTQGNKRGGTVKVVQFQQAAAAPKRKRAKKKPGRPRATKKRKQVGAGRIQILTQKTKYKKIGGKARGNIFGEKTPNVQI